MNLTRLFIIMYEIIKREIRSVFSIQRGTDMDGTIEMITSGVRIRGANSWILICGAMLASIGLDTNSSAIIIGAMLISPLMSPILGIGLSFGISDRGLLVLSLKNFGIAVGISLLAATVYFLLTPLGQPTMELASRTKPTLLDVGVAIFGGVAGIVSNSRREKTNAIPGVAIATALMPPLCTAGYGLASGDMAYFLGAFYLFFINAVFISLSTFLMVRFLKFPIVEFVDDAMRRKIKNWIMIVAILVIIPSGIIFWDVIQEVRLNQSINHFVDYVDKDVQEVLSHEITESDSTKIIKIFVIGEGLSQKKVNAVMAKMTDFNLEEFELKIAQTNISVEDKERLLTEVSSSVQNKFELKQLEVITAKSEKQQMRDSLNYIISLYQIDSLIINQIKEECKVIFPDISSIAYGKLTVADSMGVRIMIPTSVISFSNPKLRDRDKRKIGQKYKDFIKLRVEVDSMLVYY
jgi:uncharacterized hydrophobic protein (TIGR00271 family)